MTIHFFTKGDINDATARFRGYFMADELKKLGVDAITHEPLIARSAYAFSISRYKEFVGNFKILFNLKNDDILYLVRTIYQLDFFILVVFFRVFFRKKFIFDFDDPKFFDFPIKMKILTKLSSTVIVGSHYLADWAKIYNNNVYIIPTSVPFDIYSEYTKQGFDKKEFINIGWIGIAPNHLENLKIIIPVFEKLLKNHFKFQFTLIGAISNKSVYDLFRPLIVAGLKIDFVDQLNWHLAYAAPSSIKNFDIGIMPLVDNDWNKGKCSFKAIEYMACAVPVVISDVGENKYLINHMQNGFLASSDDVWYNILQDLISKEDLRKKIGFAGQKTISENYTLAINAKKILDIIKKI